MFSHPFVWLFGILTLLSLATAGRLHTKFARASGLEAITHYAWWRNFWLWTTLVFAVIFVATLQ